MDDLIETDICVIGAGSGGLSVAAGAAQMGASTVLIEGGRMGGDCLNFGCVPSKALLAAGHHAVAWRRVAAFGLEAEAPAVDFGRVADHVREVIDGIAPHDSVERFEAMGVRVIRAWARFTGRREVSAGGCRIRARRFVVATGSTPVAPPIPGLDALPYFTNETIFENRERPHHLIVIGAGPVGLELAQAHRRLGARVTVLEAARALGRDDPELAAIVLQSLRRDGVEIREGVEIRRLERGGDGPVAVLASGGGEERIAGSHLLVAAGRKANVERLDLDAAGIALTPKGIAVDRRLRSSNHRVFAVGDVAGGPPFTHVAGHHAGIVLRNALFRLPAKMNDDVVPWVTYTEPELAWVGLSEEAARARHGRIDVLRWPYAENDRARAERVASGLVKAIVSPRGRILGAGIVGAAAGELIGLWALALHKRLGVGDLAGCILPYPTLGEISKRAAGSFYAPKLFSPRTRRLVRLLAKLG